MARSFAGSPNSIVAASAAVASYPISMACWVRPTSVSVAQSPLGLGANGASDASCFHLRLTTGAQVQARAVNSIAGSSAVSSTGTLSADLWAHVGGVFVGNANRTVYLNGSGTNQSTTRIVAPSAFAESTIGCRATTGGSYTEYFQGAIADAAWWAAELTADEMAKLAAGHSPLSVRPRALRAYTPLFGRAGESGNEEDWVGGLTFVQNSSPALADHPRIIYPRRTLLVPVGASGGSFAHSQTESLAASDVISASAVWASTSAESATVSHSQASSATVAAAQAESATVSHSQDTGGAVSVSCAESLSAYDLVTATAVWASSSSDSATVSDGCALSGTLFAVSIAESVSVADAMQAARQCVGAAAESGSLGELLGVVLSVTGARTDTASVADAVFAGMATAAARSDSLSVVDICAAPVVGDYVVAPIAFSSPDRAVVLASPVRPTTLTSPARAGSA